MSLHSTGGATLRDDWEFEYTASTLAKAAADQRDYRQSRVTVWEERKTQVMAEIRATGITITESEAEKLSSASYSTHSSHGPRIMIDATMQTRLTECQAKINEHRGLVKEYGAWVQVLEANPESRLKLTHADWMFFFGK